VEQRKAYVLELLTWGCNPSSFSSQLGHLGHSQKLGHVSATSLTCQVGWLWALEGQTGAGIFCGLQGSSKILLYVTSRLVNISGPGSDSLSTSKPWFSAAAPRSYINLSEPQLAHLQSGAPALTISYFPKEIWKFS
jgi:hypothetical protein